MINKVAREVLAIIGAIGTLVAGMSASLSPSCSLPAILFMLAGFGFLGVIIYYLVVRGVDDTNK